MRFPSIKRKAAAGAVLQSAPSGQSASRDLPNTPPIASESVRQFSELVGGPLVFGSRTFVVCCILGAITIVQGVALVRLFPLKRTVLTQVEMAPDGTVAGVREVKPFRPESRFVKAALIQWAKQMLVIDPYRTRDELRRSTLVLRGKAVSEHKEWLEREKVFRRLAETPGLVRTVDKQSADVSKDGIAFLFLNTTERATLGEPKLEQWRLTVHYALVPSDEEEEVSVNPLGLNITHFELVKVAL